jgi:hypothetical protein
MDGSGGVVAAGYFSSTAATFGDRVLSSISSGYTANTALVWKLTSTGSTLWAVRGGGTSYDYLQGVAVDGSGGVVAAGYFSSSVATFGDRVMSRIGSTTAVVWKMTSTGSTLWAVRGGGTSYDYLQGVAVDGSGGVVAAGYFSSSVATFGDRVLSRISSGTTALVWKMTSTGSTLWAVRGGGTSYDYLQGVAVDGSGGVVAAGRFSSIVATFGDRVLSRISSSTTAVVWKMSATGSTLWAVQGGGTGYDRMQAIAIDGSGNVVGAGSFGGSVATFGDVVLSGIPSGGYGGTGFVWKLNSDGTTLWAVPGGEVVMGVAVDWAGGVVLAGYFIGVVATFGDRVLSRMANSADGFVWKVDGEGTTQWAVRGGGTSYEYLNDVAVNGTGHVATVGHWSDADDNLEKFGDVSVPTNGLASSDALVWKLFDNRVVDQPPSPPPAASPPPPPTPPPASPAARWADFAVTGGGSSSDHGDSVAVGLDGSIVAAGVFQSAASTFGDVSSFSSANSMLWKMSSLGTTLWVVAGGGGGGGTAGYMGRRKLHYHDITIQPNLEVALDYGGNIFAAGSQVLDPKGTFGGVELTGLSSYRSTDAVVWKVSADGTTLWAVLGGGTNMDLVNGVAADSAGNALVSVGSSASSSSPSTFGDVTFSTNAFAVWKLSAQGTTLWAAQGSLDYLPVTTYRSWLGSVPGSRLSVAVDRSDNAIAVAGVHGRAGTFGHVTFSSSMNILVWKVSDAGITEWAIDGGSSTYDDLNCVIVDSSDDIITAGKFGGKSSAPMGTFGNVTLAWVTGTGVYTDAVVWKLSGQGTTRWTARGGGVGEDSMNGVAVDEARGIVAVGQGRSSLFQLHVPIHHHTIYNFTFKDAHYYTAGSSFLPISPNQSMK